MNDQQETTANTPSDPKLCEMGCGFFGSNATGDCCSKCFNEKNNAQRTATPVAVARPQPSVTLATTPVPATSPAPVVAAPTPTIAAEPATVPSPMKKKKKKKVNYRNMIAGMMEQSGPRDVEKEKESIQKVTGGGAFVKIDKI